MPSSIINSDDGVVSGTSGLKSSGGDDGVLVFQSKGTETARINTDKQIVAAAGTNSLPALTTTGDLNTGIYFPAADTIGFVEGGAEAMRIDSSGNVLVGITTARANAGDVQVSKGISFPATQSASSNANTLDDYEEGTWTPTYTSLGGTLTGVTYTTQIGRYTKIGNVVFLSAAITLSNKGSGGTGAIRISNLPFTVANISGYFPAFGGEVDNLVSDKKQITFVPINNATTIAVNGSSGSTTAAAGLEVTDINNTTTFRFGIYYPV